MSTKPLLSSFSTATLAALASSKAEQISSREALLPSGILLSTSASKAVTCGFLLIFPESLASLIPAHVMPPEATRP